MAYGMEFWNEPGWIAIVVILVIWEAIWKGFGLWKSARNNHLAWFVCILIFNTAGILPILYIYFFSKKARPEAKRLKMKK
jgi:hypothetical protein